MERPLKNAHFCLSSSLRPVGEGENFNHRNTLSILRINPPEFGDGLKIEPEAEIGQKGGVCKGIMDTFYP